MDTLLIYLVSNDEDITQLLNLFKQFKQNK